MAVDRRTLGTARTEQTATPTRHLPYIDGIRGASAAYVVLFHMYQFAGARFAGVPPVWWRLFKVLSYGDCGVAVFIVLSGYCLMLPVAADRELQVRGGLRRFAIRRLRRLGPGYAAALVGSSIVIASIPVLHRHSATLWDASLPAFSAGTIVAHLLLIQNWSRTWRYEIDTPLWSVALEAQIYAVFVLALLPLWRRMIGRRPGVVVLVACSVVTVGLMAAGLSWAQPWMLLLFAFGMCAAEASQRSIVWIRGRVDVIVLLAAAAVVATLAVERRFLHSYDSVVFVRELVVGVAAALLLLALQHADADEARLTQLIAAMCSTRPLRFLGEISYSLYLVHFPITGAIALTWVYGAKFGVPENFAVIVLVAGSLSIVAATGFHRLFERPYVVHRNRAVVPA